jgi:hypothetical protein
MQGLYFVYFYKTYCYIFLMFYIYIFKIYETSSCERWILALNFVWQNVGKCTLYTGLHESNLFVYAVFI